MRLPVLDLDEVTVSEQFLKIREEVRELGVSRNRDNQLEECLDVLQATLGLLIRLTQTKVGLENATLKHCLKLQGRETNGSFKIKNWLNIKFEEDAKNG